jgi:two-component system LytT family response regulator
MRVRILVIEDEPLARERLVELLKGYEWVQVIGEAVNGKQAVAAINSLRPDLILLDIQLPDLDGLGVLRKIKHRPAIIFTTAYNQHAVSAFEFAAVDYLLKPFSDERLDVALNRARANLANASRSFENGVEALAAPKILERIWLRHGGKIVPVQLREVERMEADGDYVALITRSRRFLLQVPMAELENRLDANRFIRVHRSHIVNLDFVESLTPEGNAQLSIRLRDGTALMASRSASKALRELEL